MWTIKLFWGLSKFKEDCSVLTNIISLICDNSVTTTVSQQQCHNNSVTTTVSQLKICDFSGETLKGFEVL